MQRNDNLTRRSARPMNSDQKPSTPGSMNRLFADVFMEFWGVFWGHWDGVSGLFLGQVGSLSGTFLGINGTI